MNRSLTIATCGLATAISSGCGPSTGRRQGTVLTVTPTRRQTIKGWGIYPCTIQNDRQNADLYTLWKRPNAQRLIFKELGASVIRSEILPGSYNSKKDDGSLDEKYLDESLVRQLRLAKSFGQTRYFLSVWSPPALFKWPATTLGQDPKTHLNSHLRPDREDDYCRYIIYVLDYLTKKKHFAAPIAFSFQNEPNYAASQWNGTQYGKAQWQRVAVKMKRTLRSAGYGGVDLIGPEGGGYADSANLLGGNGAPDWQKEPLRSSLDGLAFHGYSRQSRGEYGEQMSDIASQTQKHGKDVWMSEWSIIAPKRTPLDHALEVTQRLSREMAFVPCNYWCWWQGWYWQHPKSEVLITGDDDAKLHISKTYWVLQKLWHVAPAGSAILRVQSGDPEIKGFDRDAVETVAFATKSGQAVLLTNPTSHSKTVELQGLTGPQMQWFVTNQKGDMRPQPILQVTNGCIRLTLGARSIAVMTSPLPLTPKSAPAAVRRP